MDLIGMPSTSFGLDNVDVHATTEVNVDHFSFLWTLTNYSSLRAMDSIMSPVFRGGPLTNHAWQVKISPKTTFDEMDFFGVEVILRQHGDGVELSDGVVNARFKITLLNDVELPGRQAGGKEIPACRFKLNSVWGFKKLMPSFDVEATPRKLVNDDCLKVLVEMWIEGPMRHKVINGGATIRGMNEEQKSRQLAMAYQKVFDDTSNKDFTLITSTGKIQVHKSVLQAWSPVFKAMFENDMAEKKTNEVTIIEFEHDVVHGMLMYLYTGSTPSLQENATELLKIAEKYGIATLKEECQHVILENVTIENCAELFDLAETHHADILLSSIMQYMNWNREEIVKTDGFKRIKNQRPALFVNFYMSN